MVIGLMSEFTKIGIYTYFRHKHKMPFLPQEIPIREYQKMKVYSRSSYFKHNFKNNHQLINNIKLIIIRLVHRLNIL